MALRQAKVERGFTEVLKGFDAGFNSYIDPEQANPAMWFAASNIYSGLFATLRRRRKGPVFVQGTTPGYTALAAQTVGKLFPCRDLNGTDCILSTLQPSGVEYSFETNTYTATKRVNPYLTLDGNGGNSTLSGQWSRIGLLNQVFEMNGTVKQKGRATQFLTIDSWGLDAPDTAPLISTSQSGGPNGFVITAISRTQGVVTVTTSGAHGYAPNQFVTIAGVTNTSFNGTFQISTVPSQTTFTYIQGTGPDAASAGGTAGAITSTGIGRSYTFAFEDNNNGHVGAPAPVSAYQNFTATPYSVIAVGSGVVTVNSGSPTVTGSYDQSFGIPAFTSAWVGRHMYLFASDPATSSRDLGRILSVQSTSSLTLANNSSASNVNGTFIIFDPRATHIRIYATGDGGTTYFRIARVQIFPATNDFWGSKNPGQREFRDGLNTQPPATGWTTSEQPQFFNVPPPIGSYVTEYQSRAIVFGVAAAPQTFFYSNQEFTGFGTPPESFAPLNQVTLPMRGSKLNGMAQLPTGLVIWSDKQDMWKLTGVLVDNNVTTDVNIGGTIQRLPYDLGCYSPTAIAVTPLGVFWLTPDKEVRLFTDNHAPRNVGRPIQSLLNTAVGNSLDAHMTYYRTRDHNWLLLAFTPAGALSAGQAFVLDLDLLESTGEKNSYIFNERHAQPSWYIFDGVSGTESWNSMASIIDNGTRTQRLFAGGTSISGSDGSTIKDLDYDGTSFLRGAEQPITGANVVLHAWGNKDPEVIKDIAWARFTTNRSRSQLTTDGWSFVFQGFDDDFYTFPENPLSLTLTPGTNDAATLMAGLGGPGAVGRAFEYGTGLFRLKGATISGGVTTQRIMRGRRIRLQINFPSSIGTTFEFRGVTMTGSKYQPR